MKSADIEAEWQIAPGPSGRAAVASIVPGGTLTFEHRNIARKGRQVAPCYVLALSAHSTAGLGMLKGVDCGFVRSRLLKLSSCCRRVRSIPYACHHSGLLCLLHANVSSALSGQGFVGILDHAFESEPCDRLMCAGERQHHGAQLPGAGRGPGLQGGVQASLLPLAARPQAHRAGALHLQRPQAVRRLHAR